MDVTALRDMIAAIRNEADRRGRQLKKIATEHRYDQWVYYDEPLLNELCLLVLIAIRHEVERDLLGLGARVSRRVTAFSQKSYLRRLANERKQLRSGWKPLIAKLGLAAFPAWTSSMETLRLLANCYKHDPFGGPDDGLLKHLRPHLKYKQRRKYDVLPESNCFREGLALSLGLPRETDYVRITEDLLAKAEAFVDDVKGQSFIAEVRRGHVSLHPRDFVC
jgi:hypothetical protein